ncbi:MAG: LamG-like jellyroll fold domain-containing protein, partial [Candidatus Kapaibacterium sp.]
AGRMTVTPADPSRIYVVLLGDSSRPYILRSDNAGESWRVSARGKSDSLAMNNGQGYYDLGIAASHRNADILLVGTTTCYRSNDGGTTFPVTVGGYSGVHAIHPDIQEIKCLGDDCYIATDGGFNLSTDMFGSNYAARTVGLNGADFWGFDAGWNEDVLVGGRYHNGNTAWHENYGSRFLRMGGGEAATGYVHPMRNRDVYFSDIGAYTIPTASDRPVQSRPVGMFPNESYYAMEYSAMKWHPVYTSEVWMGNKNSIMRSIDNGASYAPVFTSPDTGAVIQHVEICRSNPDVMYVSQRSNILYDGKIWKSTNAGTSWSACADLPSTTRGERRVMKIAASSKASNTLFVALLNGSKSNKVFKTMNGGATWVNLTTDAIANQGITDIIVQYGTDDGVYIACYNGKVYYRNASMTDWVQHGDGLPYALFTRALKPFYRDNKVRTGSSLGIWEAPLYEHSKPEAQPCVDKRTSACVRDTFFFDDYSVLELSNARRRWSFPGASYVSDSTARDPRVLYDKPGTYSVTLTVSNDYGTSTKTLENVVSMTKSECDIDGVAGAALDLGATNDVATIPALPRLGTTRGFSASCWVKLDTIQQSFSQILSNWNSPVGFSLGFSFQGYRANTNLTFYWKNVPYQLTSPFNLPVDEWTHVAVSVDSEKVTLYRNGTPWVYRNANAVFSAPVLNTTSWEIGGGLPGQGGNFRGSIDELQIFDRALDSTQVRERMNLISNPPGYVDTSRAPVPVAYYQFNEPAFTRFYNRTGATHAVNSGGRRIASTCPVGPGVSSVTKQKDGVWESAAGMTVAQRIGSERTIVVTRIDARPNVVPGSTSGLSPHYWVVRSYGAGTPLGVDSVRLRGTGTISAADAGVPQTLRLYARGAQEYRNTWTERSVSRSADTMPPTCLFPADTDFVGQFILGTTGSSPLDVDDDEDDENGPLPAGTPLHVVPVPGVESVTIITSEPAMGMIDIVDITGRVVLREPAQGAETRLDTSSLPPGLYVVSLKAGATVRTAPLLIGRSAGR